MSIEMYVHIYTGHHALFQYITRSINQIYFIHFYRW